MSITLFCLFKGTADTFPIHLNGSEFVGDLKEIIKEKNKNDLAGIDARRLKLWRVNIKEPELTTVSRFSVDIKEELGGVELSARDKISVHLDESVENDLYIIVEPPTENKEVHCTTAYGTRKKKINFRWIVSREMVTLECLNKKIFEYYTFPEGTKPEHLVVRRVIDTVGNDRITEPISSDKDLVSIIWTSAPQVNLEMIVDTSQQEYATYTYIKMKTLFGLQVDDYNHLPTEHLVRRGNIPEGLFNGLVEEILRNHKASPLITGDANEATRRIFITSIIYAAVASFNGDVKIVPEFEINGTYGKGPIDYIIRVGDVVICVVEAKKNELGHGIGQSTVQAHASMQNNRKKRGYEDADLNDEEMYCIISTGIDWVITKVILKGNDNDNVEIRVCLPRFEPIPLNKISLKYDDISGPVKALLSYITGLLADQKDSLKSGKRHRTYVNAP